MTKYKRVKKICSVLGCCLLLLPTGVQWYWGNLETYVFSYFHQRSSTVDGSASRWLNSVFLVTRVISLIASGYVLRVFSQPMKSLLGLGLFNVGVLTSFLAIRHSVAMLCFTLGGICGIGTGIVYGATLEMSVTWADNDVGLILAVVQSSYTFGAIIIIQFITLYTNPRNLPAVESDENYAYFDLGDDNDRVPFTFIILGVSFIILQLFGFFLIWLSPKRRSDVTSELKAITDSVPEKGENTQALNSSSSETNEPSKSTEFTVKKMLCSRSFYVIWLTHLLGNYPYLILTNDYKSFGQLRIKDDHFMSILGIAIVVVSVVMKIIYGIISDKFGFKLGLILTFCIMTVSTGFMYPASLAGKWVYFAVVLVLAMPSGTILTSHTIAAVRLFGCSNVVINTGFMSSAAIVILLAAPPLMASLVEFAGWVSIFYSGSAFALVSLLLIVVFL